MKFAAALPVSLVLLAALTGAAGCSSTQGIAQEEVFQTPDGIAIVDTFTTVAGVTAVDAASRKVTLTTPDGKSNSYKAAPGVEMRRFHVGEQIAVRVMDETLLSIKHDAAPAQDSVATSFAAATDDGGTATFEGEAVEVSAKIVAVNARAHTVTLQLGDGTTKTLKAHSSVDLNQATVGATVVVRYAVAVLVATA
jgi:hypothetical protein